MKTMQSEMLNRISLSNGDECPGPALGTREITNPNAAQKR
jgi:hypothetical protein